MKRLASRPTGTGDIIIPHLEYDLDAHPTTRNPYNDEFERVTGRWVTMQGSGIDFTSVPSCVSLPSATSMYRVGVPPMPFTVTAKCADVAFDNIGTAGNASLGLGEANPATGKMIALELDIPTAGNTAFYAAGWTALAFGGNIGTIFSAPGFTHARPHFQRLVVNSSTSVDGYFSYNGKWWIQQLSAYNPGFTIGSVVVLSYACKSVWDWVRFTY